VREPCSRVSSESSRKLPRLQRGVTLRACGSNERPRREKALQGKLSPSSRRRRARLGLVGVDQDVYEARLLGVAKLRDGCKRSANSSMADLGGRSPCSGGSRRTKSHSCCWCPSPSRLAAASGPTPPPRLQDCGWSSTSLKGRGTL